MLALIFCLNVDMWIVNVVMADFSGISASESPKKRERAPPTHLFPSHPTHLFHFILFVSLASRKELADSSPFFLLLSLYAQ
jgi:hypothetical protein